MNNNAQNQFMEEIAEELNEEFRSMVVANVTQKGNLHIALKTSIKVQLLQRYLNIKKQYERIG